MLPFVLFLAGAVTATCPPRPSYEQVEALAQEIEGGDSQAAHCLASRLQQLDGGLAEDATRALGQYGDRKPANLLRLSDEGMLSDQQLTNAVSMLPLSLVDDFQAQFKALAARRDRFQKVTVPELKNERRLVLKSIEATLDETRRNLPRR
jgi:hypothetical protein